MPETYEYEYIDREHYDTICLGTFENAPTDINVLEANRDTLIGRRFIAPTYILDQTTRLPIILTIKDVRCYHFMTENHYGSLASDICFLETQ